MKKILYIINEMREGGAEIGLINLIKNGLFEKYQFKVVCLGRVNNGLEKNITELTNVVFLNDRELSSKKLPRLTLKLMLLINKEQPDIIITSLPQATLVGRVANILQRAKLFTFEHNSRFRRKVATFLIEKTDFLTDVFLCDSKATEHYLKSRVSNVSDENIINLPLCFFDMDKKSPLKTLDGDIDLVSVGRLVANKGHKRVILAVNQLVTEGYNVKLSIYGDGPLRSELEDIVVSLNLSNNVLFHGFVRDWPLHCKEKHIFCLASDYEGLSMSTLEAMSVGLVPIVRPVGEIKNYIVEGETGFCFDTVAECKEKIANLIHDKEMLKLTSYNAYTYIFENFNKADEVKAFNKVITAIDGD
ncbi:TPA: glycosyltransferase [Klebsiella quasipneumoniae subsp. similipneumoniae]